MLLSTIPPLYDEKDETVMMNQATKDGTPAPEEEGRRSKPKITTQQRSDRWGVFLGLHYSPSQPKPFSAPPPAGPKTLPPPHLIARSP